MALANRAGLGKNKRSGLRRPFLKHRAQDLRDDVARALHDDRIADADILARDLVLVVKRCVLHDDAANGDGREFRHRRQRACAADLNIDVLQHGHRLLGGKFVRRRPARRPRYKAEPLLQVEPVHLVDHAVDIVAERGAVQLDGAIRLQHLLDHPAHPQRRHGKAPARDRLQDTVVRIGGQLARLTPAPGEKAQGSRRRDRRIELAQRPRRSVARVREDLSARLELPLIEVGKIGVRHIDFAAHFEHARDSPGLLAAFGICAMVRTFAVTSSPSEPSPRVAATTKLAPLIAQRNRQAIDLVLGSKVQRRVGRELQEAPYPCSELFDILIAETRFPATACERSA